MSLITLRCFMGCCPHKSAVAYALSAYILYAAYTRLRSRSVGVWRSSPPLGSSPHVLLGLMRCDSVCTPLWKGNIKQHPSLSPAQDSNYSAHTRMYASVYAQQFKSWPSRAEVTVVLSMIRHFKFHCSLNWTSVIPVSRRRRATLGCG